MYICIYSFIWICLRVGYPKNWLIIIFPIHWPYFIYPWKWYTMMIWVWKSLKIPMSSYIIWISPWFSLSNPYEITISSWISGRGTTSSGERSISGRSDGSDSSMRADLPKISGKRWEHSVKNVGNMSYNITLVHFNITVISCNDVIWWFYMCFHPQNPENAWMLQLKINVLFWGMACSWFLDTASAKRSQ